MSSSPDIIGIAKRLGEIGQKGIKMSDLESFEFSDLVSNHGPDLAEALLIAVETLETLAIRGQAKDGIPVAVQDIADAAISRIRSLTPTPPSA